MLKKKIEFEPLIHPKSDTHYPYPKPTNSSKQMGAYPSTHTHPEFVSGDTRHPPTHDQKRPGGKPCSSSQLHMNLSCLSSVTRHVLGTNFNSGPHSSSTPHCIHVLDLDVYMYSSCIRSMPCKVQYRAPCLRQCIPCSSNKSPSEERRVSWSIDILCSRTVDLFHCIAISSKIFFS